MAELPADHEYTRTPHSGQSAGFNFFN